MKKIALLGATGYIGRSLLQEFFDDKEKFHLFLFSRSKSKINGLIKNKIKNDSIKACVISEFNKHNYDVVINCTGIKSLSLLKENPYEVFKVTEEMDSMIIGYLEKSPKTLYINLSSGGVYGNYGNSNKEINSETRATININDISPAEYYAIAKINSEAKHRAIPDLNIVDLRVFAFFSRFSDVSPKFMMSEVVDCIKNKKIFKTDDNNIIRDYVCPNDLLSIVKKVIKKGRINDFFDVYSLKPISKFDLLVFLEKKYGLKYLIKKAPKSINNLSKNIYYSKNKKAERIGYSPKFSSLSGIEHEIDKMNI